MKFFLLKKLTTYTSIEGNRIIMYVKVSANSICFAIPYAL